LGMEENSHLSTFLHLKGKDVTGHLVFILFLSSLLCGRSLENGTVP
jgi:hypothetical protein